MAWIITKDYLHEESPEDFPKSNVGVQSKTWEMWSNFHPDRPRYAFKMYDDDGKPYYAGLCSSNDDDYAFGPLEDFGEPNDGCSYIEYFDRFNTKKWEVL